MLNIISVLIGAFALLLGAIAFMPLLGWMNWLVIPLAIVGLGIGSFRAAKAGRTSTSP